MTSDVLQALERDRVIDITTTGKQSGQPRRKEIWFHNIQGRIFITGLPGTRDWYANLSANPEFTFHLKEGVKADLPAVASPITDQTERREILTAILQKLDQNYNLEKWVAESPLVEVNFPSG